VADLSQTPFSLGPFAVDPLAGTLTAEGGEEDRLEPKVMSLLVLLAEAERGVVSRQVLFDKLWPGVIVGEDTLSRTVFKLRRALGDDPKVPRFLETVPKRGYRLLVSPEPVHEEAPAEPGATSPAKNSLSFWRRPLFLALPAAALAALFFLFLTTSDEEALSAEVEQATDRYMRFTRADNEAAIDLYQRALSRPVPDPKAEAGLAAALVQRVVRFPGTIGSEEPGAQSISSALDRGLTTTPEAQQTLGRAQELAERAVRRRPRDADNWRILGLVRTATGDLDGAREAYDRALGIDPSNWGVHINLAELYKMRGETERAYELLTTAYQSMSETYATEPQRVGLWRAPLGIYIAEADRKAGRLETAESWYRRVLRDEPYHKEATLGLAALMLDMERRSEAMSLCASYEARTGESLPCGQGAG
jgi:DNA-binding winged helix-turn-helix (wHTH) protein/Flp pilus assembly protein TadD